MALRETMLEIISGLLSSSSELLNVAEERKKAMEMMEEYSILLIEILLAHDEAAEERQMAGILLKQCIYSFWWKTANDMPPILNEPVKEKLRYMLPNGLQSPYSLVRNSCAACLVCIAKFDYSATWPDMIKDILSKLTTVDENTCSGILYFLNDYCRVTALANPPTCDDWILIYKFLTTVAQELEYSTETRAKTMMIFTSFPFKKCILQHTEITALITNFCMVCQRQLTLPHPTQSDYVLKHNILNVFTTLLHKIPAIVSKTIIDILPTIWEMLYRCGMIFDEMLVNETLPYRDPEENEQNTPLFYILVENVFDVIKSILKLDCHLPNILNVMPDLVHHTILFLAIPKDMEVRWKSDPEVYINEDIDEELSENSLRLAAKNFLVFLSRRVYAPTMINAITDAVDRHIVCSTAKTESYFWRIQEATMYAVGCLRDFVLNAHSHKVLQNFDIMNYLNRWAAEVGPCPSWLMLARIMWLGGQYSSILGNNAPAYIRTIADNLNASSFILTFSAIRSLYLHMRTANQSEYKSVYIELRQTLAYALMDTLDGLGGAILPMGLSALVQLLKLGPFADCIAEKLILFIINMFDKSLLNYKIVDHLQVIIKEICSNSSCAKTFQEKFLPVFVDLTNEIISPHSRPITSYNVQCNAISILTILVKYSEEPISNELVVYGFIPVSTIISRVDDTSVIQLSSECLRSYLCKATSRVLTFQDNDGRTGSECVLNILKCLLDPTKSEYMCEEVGRFFITAMHTLGCQLDQHFSFVLRGLLSAVQRAGSAPVKAPLLGIFSYLFFCHFDATVHFLTLIPGPRGQSALAFILGKLSSTKYSLDKKYFLHLHTVALCRVVELAITQQDRRILDIKVSYVKEDVNQPSCSTSMPINTTEHPILLDIIRALLETCKWLVSRAATDNQTVESRHVWRRSFGQASTSRDDDSVDPPDGSSSGDSDYISSEEEESIVEESLDPLDVNDPIYSINVVEYLQIFFSKCSNDPFFYNYVHLLDNWEKEFLRQINDSVTFE
ncbi:hypothetical protein PPYR_06118 [Photinus pyralis]|uniref:Importin N-terminal domain-containing protein n=1 Tax=Photinus pyralis TaxID=7054 RepID=A0A1Y1L714_PHOPY|nr:importin-9 [Photinus pyralis]XP_031338259.1 importin-9 [Photinus pyralis]XP_031338260.1 importin-9 [Photinus pyralis]XP_031338261.1 importin-9 [Photinus pyralis]XP_031338262.1 importin-9 [Photinus pyralis]KAB0800378.1 hypothetical protein PPYR_06118 [Photinus pyralis]